MPAASVNQPWRSNGQGGEAGVSPGFSVSITVASAHLCRLLDRAPVPPDLATVVSRVFGVVAQREPSAPQGSTRSRLDARCATSYNHRVGLRECLIRRFRRKGLRRFFESGSTANSAAGREGHVYDVDDADYH